MKTLLIATGVAALWAASAAAQDAPATCPEMRPIKIGVSVIPPRTVHTVPYIAKDLGFFEKRCIDAEIIAFEGGSSATALTAIQQGQVVGTLNHVAIGRGLPGKQIWTMAPRLPQQYLVSSRIKTPADLKGARMSASGGGVGGFNWVMGKEILVRNGMTVDDAQWIPGTNAGNLPALLNDQLDGFAAHTESIVLAAKDNPDIHPLLSFGELMPDYVYNAYGASDEFIANNRELLVDFVAAMIEANRAIYTEKDKIIPLMVKHTEFPEFAVLASWEFQTGDCTWSVNSGIDKARTEWTIDNSVKNGDLEEATKPTFEQVVDPSIAEEALKKVGGPIEIGKCKL
jgi:ABC-type nitrate/sulfonate/bicarbonate transport system substrate-binding protein